MSQREIDKMLAYARQRYTERVERRFVASFGETTAANDLLVKENAELRSQVANLQSFLKQMHDLLWKKRFPATANKEGERG